MLRATFHFSGVFSYLLADKFTTLSKANRCHTNSQNIFVLCLASCMLKSFYSTSSLCIIYILRKCRPPSVYSAKTFQQTFIIKQTLFSITTWRFIHQEKILPQTELKNSDRRCVERMNGIGWHGRNCVIPGVCSLHLNHTLPHYITFLNSPMTLQLPSFLSP